MTTMTTMTVGAEHQELCITVTQLTLMWRNDARVLLVWDDINTNFKYLMEIEADVIDYESEDSPVALLRRPGS